MISPTSFDPLCFAAISFRGWFPPWAAVILGVLAVAGTVALYYRDMASVPLWRRGVLAVVRILLLASVLFLALRPTIVTEVRGERPRPIAVLVDDTESMTNADRRTNVDDQYRAAIALGQVDPAGPLPANPSAGDLPEPPAIPPTRLDLAKAVMLNDKLVLLDRLAEVGPIRPSAFGERRVGKDARDTAWVTALDGRQSRTAIADAVADLLNRDSTELPAAVVVVTDGRDNASDTGLDELARECGRRGVPLHIYGVGSSSFGHLQLRDVAVNETLFVDDTAAIPVRYRVTGFPAGRAVITARLNDTEIARKVVDVTAGEDLREMLTFVPNKRDAETGKQELTTTIEIVSGNESAIDTLTKTVRVVDRKIKVLAVDSVPRWDFKFLQRSLLRDRRVEPEFFLTEGDDQAMDAGKPFIPEFPPNRQSLFAYDLLILGDVPATALTPEQRDMVREFVAEGGGLIAVAGKGHAPASWVGTPLADTLPVDVPVAEFAIDSAGQSAGYRPRLTPLGLRSPVLSMDDNPVDSVKVWQTLPEMFWAYPVKKLKPAAEALLVHPTEKTVDSEPMPVMASHYYGKGYVLYIGFDETWRWRFNEAEKYFGRFWSQAVYAAGVPRSLGTKLTQLSLDTPDPLLGQSGRVYARLFSPSLTPLTTERIAARLERTDVDPGDPDRSTPVELHALPGQPGDYVATLPFNAVGKYSLVVDNGADSANLDFRVTLPPDHEMSPGGMAEEAMRQLAEGSGGKFYREEDLDGLPDAVTPQFAPFTRREEILLWNRWLMLWVIGLFSAEWFLRKMNSMS